ncbi:LuxR C-terminal-related transcriptional regulator [Sphingomonas telluris]|uniref:LuxR C-terminal-related transcriptional regulator n=1 Tax=Sphingomonas telluris TaxID=2907998 RepID=UPI00344ED82F
MSITRSRPGTNKSSGKKLGISPRTVQMHRAQVMSRLNAKSLPDLIQVAVGAGLGIIAKYARPSCERPIGERSQLHSYDRRCADPLKCVAAGCGFC